MAGAYYIGEFIWKYLVDIQRRNEMFQKGDHKKKESKKMVPKEKHKAPGKVPGPGPSKKGKVKDY